MWQEIIIIIEVEISLFTTTPPPQSSFNEDDVKILGLSHLL